MAKLTNRTRLYRAIATIRDLVGVNVPGAKISINLEFTGEKVAKKKEPKKDEAEEYFERHDSELRREQ